ncbi:hypothetical protein G3A43_09340 [Paraburkholderia aspalathi]|nr:hypothetical protein [Paraburkholderia aspalathi]MBK3780429.1 hypothetical protein [Paraburkholderia aspalathi]
MRKRAGIYGASRASLPARAAMWRYLRDVEGWAIVSSWIDEAGEGETASFAELWTRIEREVRGAERLVLYVEGTDFPLKGGLVEVGIALSAGVKVFVVAPGVEIEARSCRPVGSWIHHPLVRVVPDMAAALAGASRRIAAPKRVSPPAFLCKLWRQHSRWKLADRKGWGWAGRILQARTQVDAEKALRNSNRLYRLTRGSGNPWRD